MSKETSTQKQTEKAITPVCVTPMKTLRRASIKPRRSILRVKSVRPTKAILGKVRRED